MFELSQYSLGVAAALIAFALVGYAAVVATAGRRRRTPALVHAGAAGGDDVAGSARPAPERPRSRRPGPDIVIPGPQAQDMLGLERVGEIRDRFRLVVMQET